MSGENESDPKQLTSLKQVQLSKIQMPLKRELCRKDFILLVNDVADNLNDGNYKTTTNNRTHDLKNPETFLLEIITKNISENEARKLYDDLIKGDINELEKAKGKSKTKRNDILNILSNLESVFTGVYFNYKNKLEESESKQKYEKSIAEINKENKHFMKLLNMKR